MLADNDARDQANVASTGCIEQFAAQVEREFSAQARLVKAAGVRVE